MEKDNKQTEWFEVSNGWIRVGSKQYGTRYRLSSLISYRGDEYSIHLRFVEPLGGYSESLKGSKFNEDGRLLLKELDDQFIGNNTNS